VATTWELTVCCGLGWGDAGFFSPGLQNSNLVCYQGASTSSKEQEMRRDILHLPTHELAPIGTAGIDLSAPHSYSPPTFHTLDYTNTRQILIICKKNSGQSSWLKKKQE
jgi:hypothetical protein